MLPPGSFLNNPAPTTVALRKEVATDPLLRARLRNALHLANDAAVEQFVNQLSFQRLSENKILKIYYARKAGAWGYKIRRVPAGTQVFSDATGNARLMQICGNPVETMSPAKIIRPEHIARYSASESDAGMVLEGYDSAMLPFEGNVLAVPQIADVTPGFDEIATAVGGEDVPLISAGAITPPAISVPGLAGSIPGISPLIPAAAGLLPLALSFPGSTPKQNVDVTPEPGMPVFAGTIAGFTLLGLGIARRRRPSDND